MPASLLSSQPTRRRSFFDHNQSAGYSPRGYFDGDTQRLFGGSPANGGGYFANPQHFGNPQFAGSIPGMLPATAYAAQNFGRVPNMTVGGNFGQTRGMGYAPGYNDFLKPGFGMGGGPALPDEDYATTMARVHFGGATPNLTTRPEQYGGGQQWTFAEPARDFDLNYQHPNAANALAAMQRAQAARGFYKPAGGAGGAPAAPITWTPEQQARQQAYQQRQMMNQATRQFGVQQKAMARSDARQRRLGNVSNEMAMQFGVPGYANTQLQAGMYGQGLAQQAQQFGMSHGLAQQQQQFEQNAKLMTALPDLVKNGVLTPAQGQAMMQQIAGQFGAPPQAAARGGSPAGNRTRGQLTPAQIAEFHQQPPHMRDRWLNAQGITDPVVRGFLHQQAAATDAQGNSFIGDMFRAPGWWAQGLYDYVTSQGAHGRNYARPINPRAPTAVPQNYFQPSDLGTPF